MENLLLKVVNFMFIPESSLSVIFLVVFVGCFVYGLKKIKDCRNDLVEFQGNAVEKYNEQSYHLNQKQFMTRFTSLLSAKEVKIIDLPNLFVSIGILGTFIGLGVAIHGAADLLNSDRVDLNQLNAVLSVIAFKFQTSVWGTCFSLIFQKFVAEKYFADKQIVLGKIEEAIYADAVNPGLAMQWQLAELQGMHAGQSDVKAAILQGVNKQDKFLKDSQDGFNKVNNSLNEFVNKVSTEQAAENAKQLGKITEIAQKIVSDQSELNEHIAKQQETLLGNVRTFNTNNAQQVIENVGKQLAEQKAYVTELVEKQNAMSEQLALQQKALLGDADTANKANAKNIIGTVTEQLAEQKAYMTELVEKQNAISEQFASQQKALLGDADIANKENAKSIIGTVTEQLQQQQKHMDAIVKQQTDMNQKMAEQQKILLKTADTEQKNNAKNIMSNVTAQLAEQRKHMENLLAEQNDINNKLAVQQEVLLNDADASQKAHAQSIMENVENQLEKQRAYIEKLIAQQSQLNEVLLGDMQKSGEVNANYMREGVFQQMEKYKNYAEELAKEQKKTQKALEDKLQLLNGSIDKNNSANETNNKEVRRVIDVLSKAIDNNSDILNNIVADFVDKQNQMDDMQRAQIMGIAQQFNSQFNTLLNQEGKKKASWRSPKEEKEQPTKKTTKAVKTTKKTKK